MSSRPFRGTLAYSLPYTHVSRLTMYHTCSLWLTDKAGRRTMLLVGAGGMIVCHFIVAAISTAYGDSNPPAQRALVAFGTLTRVYKLGLSG